MNVDDLARLAAPLDLAAFAKAHPAPALVFMVPGASTPSEETARSARALFFGRTSSFRESELADGDDEDATVSGGRGPRSYEIVGGSNVVFVERTLSGVFTLGRSASNRLCIPVLTVSKAHATLELRATVCSEDGQDAASGWIVRDLESSNGTSIDDRALPRGGEAPIDDGALLGVGPDVKLRFFLPPTLFRLCQQHQAATPPTPLPA